MGAGVVVRRAGQRAFRRRDRRTGPRSAAALVLFGSLWLAGPALGKDSGDDEDDAAKPASTVPNIYLDLQTYYTTLPAGALGIGFRNFTALPALSSPASQTVSVNAPITLDLNDRVSVYGGVSSSTTRTDATSWTSLTADSWNIGIQADVIQQNGGSIPTVTVQSTLSRSIASTMLSTATLTSIVDFDYALDPDETRGLLAGVRYVSVTVDSDLARVRPSITGYLGGYYQWPSNWKLSGRFGVQSFGGAQILALTPFQPFTQPIVRFDLERLDDDDNRLFGLTAEISWVPKPAYQLTLRTPLYVIKN
jgi:opacity protein-like surface antigen